MGTVLSATVEGRRHATPAAVLEPVLLITPASPVVNLDPRLRMLITVPHAIIVTFVMVVRIAILVVPPTLATTIQDAFTTETGTGTGTVMGPTMSFRVT